MAQKDDHAEGFADGTIRMMGCLKSGASVAYLDGLQKAVARSLEAIRDQIRTLEDKAYQEAKRATEDREDGLAFDSDDGSYY